MELLRSTITTTKSKLKDLNRDIGYLYLTVMRRTDEDFIRTLLNISMEMLCHEESVIYNRHFKKWSSLTGHNFPLARCVYELDHKPSFIFHLEILGGLGGILLMCQFILQNLSLSRMIVR